MTNPVQPAVSSLLSDIEGDGSVLGVVLTGSRARAGMATERSDSDVILVVTDDSRAVHLGSHSTELDIGVYTLTELQSPALPWELSHHPLAAPVVARSAGFLGVLDSRGDDLAVFGGA